MSGLEGDHKPAPMMNGKPVEKHPTAADKFDEQQTEYESRGKTQNRMKQVHEHNSGYAQLKDELNKRRSTARPLAILNRSTTKTPEEEDQTSRSRQVKNPHRKTDKKPKGKRNVRSRVTKKRKDRNPKLSRTLKYFKNFRTYMCDYCGCQYLDKDLRIRASTAVVGSSEHVVAVTSSGHIRPDTSNTSHKYPGSSVATMSSYHSFFSTNEEPMV